MPETVNNPSLVPVTHRGLPALLAVISCLVFLTGLSEAQSGRRPGRLPTTSPSTLPSSGGQSSPVSIPADPPEDNRPLADTTPISPDDEGTIRVDTSLVTIPVTVTDRQGRFVPDLQKRNFRLYEDDVEQRIDSLHSIDVPFSVVLMLDTSGSTRFHLDDIQEAAIAFIDQLRGEDRVMVVSFAMGQRVECDFTSDRFELREAIRRTRTGGGTRLYDAVDFVLNRLEQVDGRKAVVLFTDGVDTLSRRSKAQSTVEHAEESGAIFYPLRYETGDLPGQPPIFNRSGVPPIFLPNGTGWPSPGGRGRRRWPIFDLSSHFFGASGFVPDRWDGLPGQSNGSSGNNSRARLYLSELAERSGGRLSEAESLYTVAAAFSLIADELRQQYALSYYPTQSERNGAWRRIRVRVERPDCVVRSRKGYRAAGNQL